MSIVENIKEVFLTVLFGLIIGVLAPFVFWYVMLYELNTILIKELSRLYELLWFRNLLFVLTYLAMVGMMLYLFIQFYY